MRSRKIKVPCSNCGEEIELNVYGHFDLKTIYCSTCTIIKNKKK